MVLGLSLALTGLCLVVVVWAVVKIVTRQPVLLTRRGDQVLLGVLALVELGLVVQAVVGFVLGAQQQIPNLLTFGVYLVGVLLILPVGTFWALADRSRGGAGVLVVACVTVPAMVLRMHQVYAGG
ncbi:hypothetical protein [Desertihabitans aurantiacus]|uniref:hypothetical protein n=1 Tax=Desertihabitans aurantiacus TaxID=2282477 RepID=UPI000DF8057E|nr:hypothetical protein [Desertihabitans aurantiacus]